MAIWKKLWIAKIIVEQEIAAKISLKHGVSVDLVERYFLCNHEIFARKIFDFKHGARFLIYSQISEDKYLRGYVDCVNHDYSEYRLRSARITSQIPQDGR
jgi:hypothetical protein